MEGEDGEVEQFAVGSGQSKVGANCASKLITAN